MNAKLLTLGSRLYGRRLQRNETRSRLPTPGFHRKRHKRKEARTLRPSILNSQFFLHLIRSAFKTTETELQAMAAPASIGDRMPKAASGMPMTL